MKKFTLAALSLLLGTTPMYAAGSSDQEKLTTTATALYGTVQCKADFNPEDAALRDDISKFIASQDGGIDAFRVGISVVKHNLDTMPEKDWRKFCYISRTLVNALIEGTKEAQQ